MSKPQVVLGLDLGTKTGWCLWDGNHVESGFEDFSGHKDEVIGGKFGRFREWYSKFITQSPQGLGGVVDLYVEFERPHFRGWHPTLHGVGFVTIVHEVSAAMFAPVGEGVHTTKLKKWATGSGRASKAMMVAAANKVVTIHEVVSDDEADAIHVARWGWEQLQGEPK